MLKKTDFKFKFWGVRGSIALPGKQFSKYGGNTACIEIRCGKTILILDAGTGIRNLGLELMHEFKNKHIHLNVLISHTHWDHIQGFPFLPQIYIPKNKISIYGGHSVSTLEKLIMVQMHREYHPVTIEELAADIDFIELKQNTFKINDIEIMLTHLLHPGLSLGFKITYKGKVFTYLSDNEILHEKNMVKYNWENIGHLIENADVVVSECQYTEKEYQSKIGWGHSSINQVVKLCNEYKVKKLYTFHHDPNHTDKNIDKMIKDAKKITGKNLKIFGSKEGEEFYI